ncbi:adenosylcobinamide-phosphate synthase CbiB [uncultured Phascolarctobacterium sp.]|jgi:adenosylcobinamide-phosphate synthase|uniref:adenosylcobinamide-phosphate synthase CbiB n=1 Tax=uncultured Phascolarctobacterium sp. TaxID=512296 RepID=UPI0025D48E67|nr:adenosylcobinamide-phosphate synthase CbiB [uncultured Phascolarctobacterium sp.]
MMTLGAIVAGFILDLIFGDPHWLPHPICLIGNLIGFLEKNLRRLLAPGKTALLLGGALMVVIVISLSFAVPYAVLMLAEQVNPWLRFALETIMFYQIFATKCLRDESMKVYTALHNNDLEDARVKLSWIVGRDTKELTTEEVTKGAVETVAENTADGIIAPMFYMFIGGAPLAFLYKGINTMDSMVGYKNDKFLYFGRCAAKLDDVANFIPARITGILMILASYFLNMNAAGAWKIFWRDRYNHLSPNSAMTESVTAGALNIQLGGDHYYFGKLVHKDTIGDNIRPVEAEDIVAVNNLLYMTAVISLLLFSLVYLVNSLILK